MLQVLWIFLQFRERIIENYPSLFTGGGSEGPTSAEASFGSKWGWYQSIYALAGGDVLKFGEVTKTNLGKCLMWMEFEKEKNELERMRIERMSKR